MLIAFAHGGDSTLSETRLQKATSVGRIAFVDGRHLAHRAFDVNRKYNFLLVRTRIVVCVQSASAAVLAAGFLRGLSRDPLIQQVAYTVSRFMASRLYSESLIQ